MSNIFSSKNILKYSNYYQFILQLLIIIYNEIKLFIIIKNFVYFKYILFNNYYLFIFFILKYLIM